MAFRNSTFNLVCKLAKGDECKVFAWVQECVDPKAYSKLEDSNPFPLLDRVLGSKLLELAKGTRFALHFQTIQETAQKLGRQPKGRQLLWVIFERYEVEQDRVVALFQNHLLNLKMNGSDLKALDDFRNKFDFIAQALEVADRPSDTAIPSLLAVWAVETASQNAVSKRQIQKRLGFILEKDRGMAIWETGRGNWNSPEKKTLWALKSH